MSSIIPYQPTLLRVLVTDRHWQKFSTFERRFQLAAAELAELEKEPDLKKVTVSPRQFERWYSGKVKTTPHPDACRILEHMFGHPIRQLITPVDDSGSIAEIDQAATNPTVTVREKSQEHQNSDLAIECADFGEVLAPLQPGSDLSESLEALRGKINFDALSDLKARVHALRLADDVLAGRDLIVPASRELRNAERVYRETTGPSELRRGLLSVVGEFAQIVGWVASDAGQAELAERTYRRGVSAAHEAEDAPLESNLLGSLAYHLSNSGDHRQGLELAQRSLAVVGENSVLPRARALAWDRLAWAAAQTGSASDAQTSVQALNKAREALSQDTDQDDPPYLYWVCPEELQIMEARVYTELRRPLRAVPILMNVLSSYDNTHTRELALYLSWLAVALADANEPEEAAKTGRRMLALSSDLASERITYRAKVVHNRLQRYRDAPEVAQFLDEFRMV